MRDAQSAVYATGNRTVSPVIALLLALAYVFAIPAAHAEEPLELPADVRETLDKEYPGWVFASATPEVLQFFMKHKSPFKPHFVWGDFDSDNQQDYAVQIALTQPDSEEQIVTVFLRRPESYEETILESRGLNPRVHLWKRQLPSQRAAPEGGKAPMRDVLVVRGGEIGESVYAYDNGKFHEVVKIP
jgi:hypothetical protein